MNIVCDTSPITNLLTIGKIEILREVFQKGFIKSVKPIIDKLIIQAGFRIHPALYQEVLKKMNE